MKECKSGRIIVKKRQGKEVYFIRLNYIEAVEDGKKYSTKDIPTGIKVGRKADLHRAELMLKDVLAENSIDPTRIYYHKYLDEWLETKRMTADPVTVEGYEFRVKILKEYFIENKRLLSEITVDDIEKFNKHLLTVEHGTGKRRTTGYSNVTVRDIMKVLGATLAKAKKSGRIANDPYDGYNLLTRVEDKKERSYIGEGQLDAFYKAIEGNRLEAPFTLALQLGLRRSEICGLKWSAIRDGYLYIESTVVQVVSRIEKDRTKSQASRRCYKITPDVQEMLNTIRNEQTRYRFAFGKDYHDSDYIFTWEDGRPYTPDYLTKSFKKLVRNNENLDDSLTLHSLRASCVSIMIHDGEDVKNVQKYVGHSDAKTTMNVYARTNKAEQAAVSDRMASRLARHRNASVKVS